MFYKSLVSIFSILMLSVGILPAQELNMQQGQQDVEVSDAELERFAKAAGEIQVAQKGAQQKIRTAIEDEGMDMMRYQQIVQAKRQGKDANMSEKEDKAFSAVQQKAMEIQRNMQGKVSKILQSHSFEGMRFQKIAQAVQTDKSLQERLKALQNK